MTDRPGEEASDPDGEQPTHDPEAPGTGVDDDDVPEIPEPNEPG